MDQLPGIAVIGVILALWIIAFIRMQKFGGAKGVFRFFLCLFLTLVIGSLVFLFVVVPVMGCNEIFCGFGQVLIFLAISGILLIAVPIIMLTAMVERLKRQTNYKDPDSNLIR
jgi:hypothetical protein